MSKLSIAEVRRRLPVGVFFTCDYIGPNSTLVRGNCGDIALVTPDSVMTTQRRVASQSAHQMASEILTGEKAGRTIYCGWKGVTAREEGDSIVLSLNDDFVRITNIRTSEQIERWTNNYVDRFYAPQEGTSNENSVVSTS